MKRLIRGSLCTPWIGIVTVALLAGYGKKDDLIAQAVKTNAAMPGIAEIKAILEAAFIHASS